MIYAENILLCIAIPLAISLLFVRGEVRRYIAAFLLGMGVCLIAARRLRVFSIPAVVGGLSLSMSIHALYNLLVSQPGVSSVIGYLTPMLIAFALYFLLRRLPRFTES